MSPSALKDVLAGLPKLTSKELEQVRIRVQFLNGGAKGKVETEDWLLEGIADELRIRGVVAGRVNWSKLLPKEYPYQAHAVREYLLTGFGGSFAGKPSSVERRAIGQFAGSVLAAYLLKLRVPLRPKIVLSNVHNIPVAVDESFPGYWGARALGICIGNSRRGSGTA